jgi:phosphate starvation-inducible membrane PsiE
MSHYHLARSGISFFGYFDLINYYVALSKQEFYVSLRQYLSTGMFAIYRLPDHAAA